jgi:hypothetical protein
MVKKRRLKVESTQRGKVQNCQMYQSDQMIKRGMEDKAKHVDRPQAHVGSNARSLPFRNGDVVKLGGGVRGEYPKPGRVGDVTGVNDGSPDAASERRNSTQRREKD